MGRIGLEKEINPAQSFIWLPKEDLDNFQIVIPFQAFVGLYSPGVPPGLPNPVQTL